jgi:hypothetical protein
MAVAVLQLYPQRRTRPLGTHQTKMKIRVTFLSWGCVKRSNAFPEGPFFSGTSWREV